MKEILIQELNEAKEAIVRIELLQANINEITAGALKAQEKSIAAIESERKSREAFTFFFIFNIVGAIIGTFIIPIIGTIIGWIFGAAVTLGISELLIKCHISVSKKKLQKAEAYFNEEMPKALAQKEVILNQIEELNNERLSIKIPEILEAEYCHSYIVEYLISTLKSGRADSLKEALNIYEDKKHKDSVLQLQQEQLRVANNQYNATQRVVELQEQSVEVQQQSLKKQDEIIRQQKKQTSQLKRANRINSADRIITFERK